MLRYVASWNWREKERLLLKLVFLLLISSSLILMIATSQTSVLKTDRLLQQNWRTSYDILVRPAGTVTDLEATAGLVEANYLGGVFGGISLEQYRRIREIEGVDVAAPIAMVGYIATTPRFTAGELESGDFFRFTRQMISSDGLFTYTEPVHTYYYYSQPGQARANQILTQEEFEKQREISQQLKAANFNYGTSRGLFRFDTQSIFLLAGVDPEQEAQLIDFESALVQGRWLDSSRDEIVIRELPDPVTLIETGETFSSQYRLPLVINQHLYTDVNWQFTVQAASQRPLSEELLQNVIQLGQAYLDDIPTPNLLIEKSFSLEDAYHWVFETMHAPQVSQPPDILSSIEIVQDASDLDNYPFSPFGQNDITRVSQVTYQDPPESMLERETPLLRAKPQGLASDGQVRYRQSEEVQFNHPYNFNVVGVFDISRVTDLFAVTLNQVPLETYRPPLLTRRYDPEGKPVDPITLTPTLEEEAYLLRPPYALTTLEGACFFTGGDNCISAVRVRVQGVETLNEETWLRIQTIAQEIEQMTGLHTDITLGSSPTPVLIELPGYEGSPSVGTVEAPWVKQGVQIEVHRGFNRANLFFFLVLFLVGGLNVAVLTFASGQVRIRDFALLHVCGWRKTELLSFLLREAGLLMLITVLLSAAVSFAIIRWEGLDVPPERILVVIPVSAALFLLGSLFPAWQASRVIPAQALQHTYALHTSGLKKGSLTHGGYAIRSALRRPIRALATLFVVMLATGLFAVLFFLQNDLDGLLIGTFLGEHLAVQVQGYHWLIAVLGILLSLTCVAEIMLLNTHERKVEINILKAVGWRPVHIFIVFIREAAWLTLTGGLLGMMVGSLLFFRGYGFIPGNLVEVTLITLVMALGVGVSAAALPAHRAARSDPALIHPAE